MTRSTRILVRNPTSGDGQTSERARELAVERGYDVRDSDEPGETVALAAAAATEGADLVAACGGDGTLNEVVRGVAERDALDDVRLGVVPTGTGNDFAGNVGIQGVEHAFDVLDDGEVRRLDLGRADGRPFVNSCLGGLLAEASAQTSSTMKRRIGSLAYVLSTLQHVRTFDALRLDIRAGPEEDDPVWTGEAVMLVIANGRTLPGGGLAQSNVEDGLLDVVVIERVPSIDYLTRGAADRLLRRDVDYLTRLRVPSLSVTHDGDPVQFSLDGEMVRRARLQVDCLPGAMAFHVGEAYEPDPEERSALQ
ncbi:diacylglycerol/lipid kinase family protein [Halomicrococcus gelatinilyticus]|uniref:diacylglycerol/lipid kinase family protein n=1 Tax=Halomicrococcus gelatinilyticus TaxID=1702103 RepID=UPI002E135E56